MKIQSWAGTLGYTSQAKDKTTQDKEDGQSPQYEQSRKKKQNPDSSQQDSQNHAEEEKQLSFEDTLEKVGQELAAFQSDIQAQAEGLSASITGQGPGLKVVLKDGAGSVIRQFSGEEFLKMRQAAPTKGPTRGKILDRKL